MPAVAQKVRALALEDFLEALQPGSDIRSQRRQSAKFGESSGSFVIPWRLCAPFGSAQGMPCGRKFVFRFVLSRAKRLLAAHRQALDSQKSSRCMRTWFK